MQSSMTDMGTYEARLRSFSICDLGLEAADVELLAQDGFYFCGSVKKIRCYCCGLHFTMWDNVHGVIESHRLLSPNCYHANTRCGVQETESDDTIHNRRIVPDDNLNSNIESTIRGQSAYPDLVTLAQLLWTYLVTMLMCMLSRSGLITNHIAQESDDTIHNRRIVPDDALNSNIESSIRGQPAYPDLVTLSQRIITYLYWLSHSVEPIDLAEAGFFCTDFDDQVQCFFCRGVLSNWTNRDDPWTEHLRWFPTCQFAKTNAPLANENFGNTIQNAPLECCRVGQHQTTHGSVENGENAGCMPLNLLRAKAVNEAKEIVKLRRKNKELQRENDDLKRSCTCLICCSRQRNITFLPCRHMCTCNECASEVDNCCICRRLIVEKLEAFIP